MSNFSYAAAYVDKDTVKMFSDLGVTKELHLTLFFDTSAKITPENNIVLNKQSSTIKKITHWNTPCGKYLVAELDDCQWSSDLNYHYRSLGAIEDLPHIPHITLSKSEDLELEKKLQELIGKSINFDKFTIRVKSTKPKP